MENRKNGVWKKACGVIIAIGSIAGVFFLFNDHYVTVEAFTSYKKQAVTTIAGLQQTQKFANYDYYVDSLERDEADCKATLKRNPNDIDTKDRCEDLTEKRKTAERKRDELRDQLLGE